MRTHDAKNGVAATTLAVESKESKESKRREGKRKRKRSSSSSQQRVVVAEESQLVREKVDGYVRGMEDPEQGDHSVSKTATFVRTGAPIQSDRRMNFVWVVKAGAEKGKSKYTFDPDSAYIDPRDKERVSRDKLRCDVCGNLLRRPYRVRCYARRSPKDPPEQKVERTMQAEIYLVGHRCMKGLLGVPGQRCLPRSKLRLDIRKSLLNGTIFQMDEIPTADANGEVKEYKQTEVIEALQAELNKLISECAGPDAAWRQISSTPREVGVRSGANCRAFEQRPYNEEEAQTEDEGATVKPPTRRKRKPKEVKEKESKEKPENDKQAEPEEEVEERILPEPPKPGRFSKKYRTMLPKVAETINELDAPHKIYAKCLPGFTRPPYVVVIPTYGRPDRLVNETLAFLRRQKIPQNLIEIWLAPGCAPGQTLSERERYEKVLKEDWKDVHIKIGVKGVMEQRWRIGLSHPEGTHIVSFDDDIPEVFEKVRPGTSSDTMQPLPNGSLEAIIHHARDLMHQEGCYIWGLAPSANPMNLVVNRISRRNGMVNGFAYGYLNRHDERFMSIYCSPTEDVERSCRFYESDTVLLRYLMYAARTKFKAPDGISLLYNSPTERKNDEEAAIVKISGEFPHLLSVRTGERKRRTEQAMNFTFVSIGQGPLLPNGVATRAKKEDGATEAPKPEKQKEESWAQQHLDEEPKEVKTKIKKQAEDEKELLDKCVQIQEYLMEVEEGMADAKKEGKDTKETREVSNVQKLMENLINNAQADKVLNEKKATAPNGPYPPNGPTLHVLDGPTSAMPAAMPAEPATDFSDLEDDDFATRLQDFVWAAVAQAYLRVSELDRRKKVNRPALAEKQCIGERDIGGGSATGVSTGSKADFPEGAYVTRHWSTRRVCPCRAQGSIPKATLKRLMAELSSSPVKRTVAFLEGPAATAAGRRDAQQAEMEDRRKSLERQNARDFSAADVEGENEAPTAVSAVEDDSRRAAA
ncbi:Uncharacterized protein SCF082_LOCUS4189 [Durusdinium trenchii]|uniref:Glycosyltransferase 2-like domain-containing protein n=1 Tax=Durusdinium trenchii TaxID=1381693 RepID=A0ABP0I0Q3_9DINO